VSTTIDSLEQRVELLEEVVNSIQVALQNVASVEALNQILLIKQKDISDMKIDIEALRNEIELLKAEVFK